MGGLDDGALLGAGTSVSGYLIDEMIGVGGMGVVYAATHPLIGKRAAIKILKPALSNEPSAVERFITEARAVNRIGHPNIVDIFDFGSLPDGRHYYVMDLLEGESLRDRLKRTGAVHVSEAAEIIDKISSALIAAHAKGIIHRDLKPDNVFMMNVPGGWPEVRLLDWGLAKLVAPTGNFRTLTGSMLGTPVYMSPEQARASELVDARTDIYALGVMSYELLSGRPPFYGASSVETLLLHQDEPVPSLAERVTGLPEELVQLIEAMLAKDPPNRPSLAAVVTVLKRLRGTKIPTMTAAGISMSLPPVRPSFSELDPDKTIDNLPQMRAHDFEDERTRPPRATAPVPQTVTGFRVPTPAPGVRVQQLSAEVQRTMPPSGPLDDQHSALPLPPMPSLSPRASQPRMAPAASASLPEISIQYDSQPAMVATSILQVPPEPMPIVVPVTRSLGRSAIVIGIVALTIVVIVLTILLLS